MTCANQRSGHVQGFRNAVRLETKGRVECLDHNRNSILKFNERIRSVEGFDAKDQGVIKVN